MGVFLVVEEFFGILQLSMKRIYVLIACEESQVVCKALRAMGIYAYSNDILPCSGGHPEWHLEMDAKDALKIRKWDGMIGFPPCTYSSYAGRRWFKKSEPKSKDRVSKLKEGAEFFAYLFYQPIKFIALENPQGYIVKFMGEPTQWTHPWEHGGGHTKKTGFWLKGFKPLVPLITYKRDALVFLGLTKDGKPKNYINDVVHGSKDRSKLSEYLANSMARQWGKQLKEYYKLNK